mmetsp:Transcript_128959/g.223752  ORF Transcript_128959/g.223752 Transcript_128959/m.223752 type:complete len:203 (+) Transcript_128959:538-1146(+)
MSAIIFTVSSSFCIWQHASNARTSWSLISFRGSDWDFALIQTVGRPSESLAMTRASHAILHCIDRISLLSRTRRPTADNSIWVAIASSPAVALSIRFATSTVAHSSISGQPSRRICRARTADRPGLSTSILRLPKSKPQMSISACLPAAVSTRTFQASLVLSKILALTISGEFQRREPDRPVGLPDLFLLEAEQGEEEPVPL